MTEFAVIGLGRFGRAVARNLTLEGQAVLAVDQDRRRLDRVVDEVDSVAMADTTDEEAVATLELGRMATVVVAIGSRATEASLLTTAILKELQVPRIVARAFDERHARLLLAIGANEVLNPEDDVGRRLARHLAYPSIVDQIRVGESTVAEVEAPEAFAGRTVGELDLRNRHRVALLAIRRGGGTRSNPGADDALESGDLLVLLGEAGAIEEVAALK